MTELIRQQLVSGGLMLCCGMTAGLVWQLFVSIRRLRAKSFVPAFLLEVVPMVLIGYCITEFLYYSSWGKIAPQDVVCFFTGLWLWRNVYGEEGESASGVREEPQSAGYQHGTGSTKKEKRKEGHSLRKRSRYSGRN